MPRFTVNDCTGSGPNVALIALGRGWSLYGFLIGDPPPVEASGELVKSKGNFFLCLIGSLAGAGAAAWWSGASQDAPANRTAARFSR